MANRARGIFKRKGTRLDRPIRTGDAQYQRTSRQSLTTEKGYKFGDVPTDNDLWFGVTREPTAYKLCILMPTDAFDNGFTLVDKEGNPHKKKDEFMAWFDEINGAVLSLQSCVYERTFGWSVIARFTDRMLVFAPEDVKTVKIDQKDDMIISYDLIYRGADYTKSLTVSAKDVIHCATRLFKHPYKGVSALYPIYDRLVALRNIDNGFSKAMVRFGAGLPVVKTKSNDKKYIDALEEKTKAVATGVDYLVIGNSADTELEFMGLTQSKIDPSHYTEPILDQLATGMGIPRSSIIGAQAGELSGTHINQQQYYQAISALQTTWTPYIIALFKWKYPDFDAIIEWKLTYAPSDQELSILNDAKMSQIQSLYQANLINEEEARKELAKLGIDIDPSKPVEEEEEGEEKEGKPPFLPFEEKPEEEEEEIEEEEEVEDGRLTTAMKSDSVKIFADFLTNSSVGEAAKALNRSKSTISSWKIRLKNGEKK